jgi:hypothetical protein
LITLSSLQLNPQRSVLVLAEALLAFLTLRAADATAAAIVAIVIDHDADAVAGLELAWVLVAQAGALAAVRCFGASVAARPAVAVIGQEVDARPVAVDERRRANTLSGVTALSGITERAASSAVLFVVRQVEASSGTIRCSGLALASAATEAAHGWCLAANLARAAVRWIGLHVDAASAALRLTGRASAFTARTLEARRAGDAARAAMSCVTSEIDTAAGAIAGTCRAAADAAAAGRAHFICFAQRAAGAAIGAIDPRIDAGRRAFDLS